MNPASRHNAQLENDDEERDLDVASKFNANENSQRSVKANDEKQRQGFEKVLKSATKPFEIKDEGKYVRSIFPLGVGMIIFILGEENVNFRKEDSFSKGNGNSIK